MAPTILNDSTSKSVQTGYFFAAIAALLWSSSGLFAKAPIFEEWPTATRGIHLAFWRAVFASVVLLPLVRKPRFALPMIPMTFCFVAMNFTFLTAMGLTTAANVIWLQHLAPVWIFLVGVFCLGERVHRGDWTMMLMGIVGAGTILFFEIQGQAPIGMVYGVLGGVTYAGVVLSIRILRDQDSAWLIALNHLVTVACFAPWVIREGIIPDSRQFLFLMGFGIFQMGLPYLVFAWCLRRVSGHQAAAIILLEPVLTPIWVFLAWGHLDSYQPPRWWTYVGATCILVGLAIRLFGTRESSDPAAND